MVSFATGSPSGLNGQPGFTDVSASQQEYETCGGGMAMAITGGGRATGVVVVVVTILW